jgi:GNAT superfamily N-acetyltransferase
MQNPVKVTLAQVKTADIPEFREMVAAYWQALMPHAPVIQDPDQREAYFRERFTWTGGNRHPHWALLAGQRIGFISFEVCEAKRSASVEDFYIVPAERRKGYGSAMMRALYDCLDMLGVELIELNVRRDNPAALVFCKRRDFALPRIDCGSIVIRKQVRRLSALYRLTLLALPKVNKASNEKGGD